MLLGFALLTANLPATFSDLTAVGISMRYRRADVAGGTYFFTVNLAERKRTLLVDYVDMLRSVMREVKAKHPFHIDAMVILPDHLHAVWTLPVGDGRLSDTLDADQGWFLAQHPEG